MHRGAAAERVGAHAVTRGEVGAAHRLGRGNGDGALLELVELGPAVEQGLEIGVGGADRLDRLERTAGAGLEAARVEAEAADFAGGELVAALGGFLDDGDVGLHRRELALHPAHVGIRRGAGGGGELGGREDRPDEKEKGAERRRGLDPGTDPDPAQGLAVMEENVARLEHRAEHSEKSRIVGLGQHNLFPDTLPRPGRGRATSAGRKH